MSDAAELVLADRYRVVRRIGQGGMGAVFEATHVLTGRRLAVKTLLAQYMGDAVLVERFMREARAAAAIGDPHVVEVVDVGRTPEGDVYMVMELLEGRELKRVVREDHPLPVARACHIMYQLAGVMGRAHALGIIHRDLKPANVFVVRRDRDPDYVKVLDFGIARFDAASTPDIAGGATMTRTGQVVGTPSYMSPEQLKGARDLDARSDVYALGVMLYQLLAGVLPVTGDSIPDIFLKVMTTTPVPLEQYRGDVPRELGDIVRRALEREPAARYADGAELAAALEPFAAQWTPGAAAAVARGGAAAPRAGNESSGVRSVDSGLSAPAIVGAAAAGASSSSSSSSSSPGTGPSLAIGPTAQHDSLAGAERRDGAPGGRTGRGRIAAGIALAVLLPVGALIGLGVRRITSGGRSGETHAATEQRAPAVHADVTPAREPAPVPPPREAQAPPPQRETIADAALAPSPDPRVAIAAADAGRAPNNARNTRTADRAAHRDAGHAAPSQPTNGTSTPLILTTQ